MVHNNWLKIYVGPTVTSRGWLETGLCVTMRTLNPWHKNMFLLTYCVPLASSNELLICLEGEVCSIKKLHLSLALITSRPTASSSSPSWDVITSWWLSLTTKSWNLCLHNYELCPNTSLIESRLVLNCSYLLQSRLSCGRHLGKLNGAPSDSLADSFKRSLQFTFLNV